MPVTIRNNTDKRILDKQKKYRCLIILAKAVYMIYVYIYITYILSIIQYSYVVK